MEQPRLSIVLPAFNEAATLQLLVSRVRSALDNFAFEIVVVDDGSTDGSTELVQELNQKEITAFFHTKNQGKGAALRSALRHVTGDIVVVQDADLEYDPKDIPNLIQPILDGHADVVFGSRFHWATKRIHLYWHRVANKWLTWLTNLLFNLDLSDMETGYKALTDASRDRCLILSQALLNATASLMGEKNRNTNAAYTRLGSFGHIVKILQANS